MPVTETVILLDKDPSANRDSAFIGIGYKILNSVHNAIPDDSKLQKIYRGVASGDSNTPTDTWNNKLGFLPSWVASQKYVEDTDSNDNITCYGSVELIFKPADAPEAISYCIVFNKMIRNENSNYGNIDTYIYGVISLFIKYRTLTYKLALIPHIYDAGGVGDSSVDYLENIKFLSGVSENYFVFKFYTNGINKNPQVNNLFGAVKITEPVNPDDTNAWVTLDNYSGYPLKYMTSFSGEDIEGCTPSIVTEINNADLVHDYNYYIDGPPFYSLLVKSSEYGIRGKLPLITANINADASYVISLSINGCKYKGLGEYTLAIKPIFLRE